MGFKVTRQHDIFRDIRDDEKFHISDDLLFDCVGMGCGYSHKPNRVQGFNSDKAFGYALLTYFSSVALGFRRLPFCEDRIYTGYFSKTEQHADIISQLNSPRIELIAEEVRRLYEHTQASLKRVGLDEVNVRREIKRTNSFNGTGSEQNYAETLVMLRMSCDVLGLSEFEIEMDTLNSFGDEGLYASVVTLELTIPAKDILYCSALVGDRDGEPGTVESGEWIVINRSATGLVKLPSESVIVSHDMWKHDNPITLDRATDFINTYQPIVLRPFYKNERMSGTYGVRPSIKHKLAKRVLKLIVGHDDN